MTDGCLFAGSAGDALAAPEVETPGKEKIAVGFSEAEAADSPVPSDKAVISEGEFAMF